MEAGTARAEPAVCFEDVAAYLRAHGWHRTLATLAEEQQQRKHELSQDSALATQSRVVDVVANGWASTEVANTMPASITEAVAAQLKTTLQCMDLSSNGLSGEIPPAIGYLKRLNKLMLNRNQLEGGVEAVGELHNLEWVSLGKNKLLRGSIASLVDGCPKLRMLGLRVGAQGEGLRAEQ